VRGFGAGPAAYITLDRTMRATFPFVPKSTSRLARGQFWSIPLGGGRYGAGCVVGHHLRYGAVSSRIFIAGVVEWTGTTLPSPENLARRQVVRFAFAHVKTITDAGGEVLGVADIDLSGLPEEAEALTLPTWGMAVPALVARKVAEGAV
jgi:hypothetical protein